MAYLEPSFLVWSLGVIQILGLASAWLARLSEGSAGQASCQRLFFACLALVALTTMASIALSPTPKYWLASGATLSVMILAAIWDFSPRAEVEGY